MLPILKITERWLTTSFEAGRHSDRLALFEQLGSDLDFRIFVTINYE